MTTNYSLLILCPPPLLFPSFTGEEGAGWPGCWQPIITSEQSRNRQSHARGLKFSQDCRQEGTSEVSLPRSLFQSIHVSSIHPHFVAFPFASQPFCLWIWPSPASIWTANFAKFDWSWSFCFKWVKCGSSVSLVCACVRDVTCVCLWASRDAAYSEAWRGV